VDLFIALSVAFILALTLLPLSSSKRWWVRAMDFPRLQLFVLAAVALVVATVGAQGDGVLAWGAAAVAGFCLAYHAWWIVPYTRIFPVEVKPAAPAEVYVDSDGQDGSSRKQGSTGGVAADGNSLRVLVSNVLMDNSNAEALLDMVKKHNPHVLVTLETNQWWQQQLDVLEAEYPHTIKCPLENRYGMHVYSRLALEDMATRFLVQHDVPSMHAQIVLNNGQRVQAHFVHPAPPAPGENEESTERDAELLLVAKQVAGCEMPIVVTGDLNDVAWSRTTRNFRKRSGLLDPRVGRGMFNTFHTGHWFMRWPLDHLFHSDHFTVRSISRLPSIGSDHFPLLTELVLTPQHRDEQHALADDD